MVVVILAQSFVLSRFFIDRASIFLGGEKVKFLVSDFDLSSAREDRYININLAKQKGCPANFNFAFEELTPLIIAEIFPSSTVKMCNNL